MIIISFSSLNGPTVKSSQCSIVASLQKKCFLVKGLHKPTWPATIWRNRLSVLPQQFDRNKKKKKIANKVISKEISAQPVLKNKRLSSLLEMNESCFALYASLSLHCFHILPAKYNEMKGRSWPLHCTLYPDVNGNLCGLLRMTKTPTYKVFDTQLKDLLL